MDGSTHRPIASGTRVVIHLIPEETPKCEVCGGTGECLSDELDAQSLWLKTVKCTDCVGDGAAVCDCKQPATRAVRVGNVESITCDSASCTLAAIAWCLGMQP